MPALIRAPERTSALTQLAIDNQFDSLRDVYLAYWIPAPSDDREWRRSSLEYLVHFARPEEAPLFRKIAAEDEL